ncbi:MAG TPA: penicillin-binding protein 2 [Candidatus Edwardsbacteria bacterium]|nr:penicillin-binding protein 2 [Candidatus Edwardsbacteria bacterium]
MTQEIGSRERTFFVLLLWTVALLLLLLRGAQLQVLQYGRYHSLSQQNRLRKIDLAAPRGLIISQDSVIIAESRPGFDLVLVSATDWQAPVRSAARLLGLDSLALVAVVSTQRQLFPKDPVVLIKDLPPPLLARVEEHLDELPGLRVEIESLRKANFGTLGSHLIGYTGQIGLDEYAKHKDFGYRYGDYIGKGSLERQYENVLRGSDGYEFFEVDARGRDRGTPEALEPVEAVPGATLRLSIDWRLQAAAESLFAPGQSGAVVAIEPGSGRILALVSRPNFDPNIFASGIRADVWNALAGDPDYPLWDRAIRSAYPPGSTFKVVTAAAALEETLATEHTYMPHPCLGKLPIGNRVYKCWLKEGHGALDLHQAMVHSCDIYFYQLGMMLNVDRQAQWARRMGLGKPSGVDLPLEHAGLIPDKDWYEKHFGRGSWRGGVAANMAIGQGEVLVTPLQLATLYAAIGNDGVLWRPHLLLRAETADGEVIRREMRVFDRLPLSPATVAALKSMLWGVVNEEGGTGGAARIAGIDVAGKTGTAQNPHGKDHSWFAGFAPRERPAIAVAVIVENAGHGSDVAAPIAGQIMASYLARHGLTPRPPTAVAEE